jgi:hypothetical protein
MLAALTAAILAVGPCAAGGPDGPDGLTEAARLAAHAQVLEDQCRYRESAEWLSQAIGRLRQFRSEDISQTRAAGSLLAQLEIHSRDLKGIPASYDRDESSVELLLRANRVESADQLLRKIGAPACELRFARLEREVANRQAESRRLMSTGQGAVQRYDKKAAINAFERVQATNVEVPGLSEGLRAARAIPSGHPVAKAIGVLALLGGLAVGGYYGYREYGIWQSHKAASPSAQMVFSPR